MDLWSIFVLAQVRLCLNLSYDVLHDQANNHHNLLWDSARKCIGAVSKLMNKHRDIEGWRKIGNWHTGMKKLMRNLGHANRPGGKNKKEKVECRFWIE